MVSFRRTHAPVSRFATLVALGAAQKALNSSNETVPEPSLSSTLKTLCRSLGVVRSKFMSLRKDSSSWIEMESDESASYAANLSLSDFSSRADMPLSAMP